MSSILYSITKTDNDRMITEEVTYKLWESAGHKIMEAQLTADQITQLFANIEQGATAAGGNRTMIGKGKDAASAVNTAWENLKTKIQNSGPIKNVDAMYDQAAEKLKQATGGDEGVNKYVQKYRAFAQKYPAAQSFIYAALIAAAGISGAGLGGAAALGLFKMTDKLLQGEKFSSAAYSGAKTGALAYGASKLGDFVRSKMGGDTSGAGDATTTRTTSGSREYQWDNAEFNQNNAIIKNAVTSDGKPMWVRTDGGGYFDHKAAAQWAKEKGFDSWEQAMASERGKMVQALSKGVSPLPTNESIYLSEAQVALLFEGIFDKIKGAASSAVAKGVSKVQQVGKNLTTKVTADKLMSAWKKAGSPTDSKQISAFLVQQGVDQNIINTVYKQMKIGNTGGRAKGAPLSQTPNAIRKRQARAAAKQPVAAPAQSAAQPVAQPAAQPQAAQSQAAQSQAAAAAPAKQVPQAQQPAQTQATPKPQAQKPTAKPAVQAQPAAQPAAPAAKPAAPAAQQAKKPYVPTFSARGTQGQKIQAQLQQKQLRRAAAEDIAHESDEGKEVQVPGYGTMPLEMLKRHVQSLSKEFNDSIQQGEFLKAAYRTEQFYNALMALAKTLKQQGQVEECGVGYELNPFAKKVDETTSTGTTAGSAGIGGGAGLGISKSPIEKVIEKPMGESDISGLLAANRLNKSFIVTAQTSEGQKKKFRVKAQSANVAKEKFSQHYSTAKILDVKEEPIDEGQLPPKAGFNPKPKKRGEGNSPSDYEYTAFIPRGKEDKEEWAIKKTVSKQKLKPNKPRELDTGFYKNYLGNRPVREEDLEETLPTSPGGMGQSYRKFTPKSAGLDEEQAPMFTPEEKVNELRRETVNQYLGRQSALVRGGLRKEPSKTNPVTGKEVPPSWKVAAAKIAKPGSDIERYAKVKVSNEEKIVNMNDPGSDGWRVYKVKPAGAKESAIIKGLQNVEEGVLSEGMLQKLAGLALGSLIALGPQGAKADTVYSYYSPEHKIMMTLPDQSLLPPEAKLVFAIDTDTQEVKVFRGGPKGQEVQPDPQSVKQGQQQSKAKTQLTQPQAQQTQQNLKPGVVFQNNDWEARYNKDAMSDKPSCTVFSKSSRYVQVNVEADGSGTIYSSLKGRGGVQSYKYRFDSNPASETQYPNRVEKQIGIATVNLADAKGHQKLVIQTFTVLNEIVTDTINLQTLEPAVVKCVQAMNQK